MSRQLDFETDAVAWRATNPSSFGYHHGPIPYWNPQRVAANVNANHASQQSPSLPTTLSKVNTGVCDVDLDGTGNMCGTVFSGQPALRRHLRDAHPGAATNPTRTQVTVDELLQGQNTLKRWVLTGGWRDARYVREPGRGPEGGLIAQYADACERIAREDPDFRRKFGDKFHRDVVHDDPGFKQGRSRQARQPPPAAAAAAEAVEPLPQQDGSGRGRGPRPSSRQRSRSVRDVQPQEFIVISDDEEEDVKVKVQRSP
ncbi:hypothetical protein diail_3781 [Diaporthe ilicicola]|nr:hypothetical protein diail_3781 [Diaporthe ilicicola]